MFWFCSYCNPSFREGLGMPDIEYIRGEIQRTRLQALRHRKEVMQLQRAGLPTTSAEALLDRMLNKIDDLCAERDRLAQVGAAPQDAGTALVNGLTRSKNLRPSSRLWRKFVALATREGWRYQHVQAIIVAIDQYAEAATGISS
jgi:hypothetical protein